MFSIGNQGDLPTRLRFAILDIPNKDVIHNIFSESITINESLGNGYDVTIIAGDEEYVADMIMQILHN